MKRPSRSPAPQPDLNLTNLMDVVLAILVVFMITAPLISQGIKVELPKADAASVNEDRAVTISFDAKRQIFVDGHISSLEKFPQDFARAWGGDADRAVLVEGDRSVPYGIILEAVGLVRKAGATRIGFLTQPDSKE